MFQWVLINKLCEMTGLTDDAVRANIKRGYWLNGVHWRKAPNNRIWINLEAVKAWIERRI